MRHGQDFFAFLNGYQPQLMRQKLGEDFPENDLNNESIFALAQNFAPQGLLKTIYNYHSVELPQAHPHMRSFFQQVELSLLAARQLHSAGLAINPSKIGAGYTYLAQFMMHDLVSSSALENAGSSTTVKFENNESGTADLHALYGRGPTLDPEYYSNEIGHLRIGGLNKAECPIYKEGPPRDVERTFHCKKASPPITPDPRNVDSVILSQLTAMFIRFHNLILDKLIAKDVSEPFEVARSHVTACYHEIVWKDLIRRLVPEPVYQVHNSNSALPSNLFEQIPVEATFAIFRFGHAMALNSYHLGEASVGLSQLLEFAGDGNGRAVPPSDNWEISWENFFSGIGANGLEFNAARKIGCSLALHLGDLAPAKSLSEEDGAQDSALNNLLIEATKKNWRTNPN